MTIQLKHAEDRVAELESVLREIERRLREDAKPLMELVNRYGGSAERNAYKWAILGSAIHAQGFLHPDGEVRTTRKLERYLADFSAFFSNRTQGAITPQCSFIPEEAGNLFL